MDQPTAQVAHITPCTEAEGPGKRYALWFQGCPLRCHGCCNPEYLPFHGGKTRTVMDIVEEMRQAREEFGIEGITLLGGEPFAHAPAALALAKGARELGLSMMIFSGFTLEQLREKPEPEIGELLAFTDLLIDGPYLREQPDTSRRWIGSRNQRIHFLSERYQADDPCWQQRNTLEIRVRGAEVTVNGFPAQDSKALWMGWKRKPLPQTGGASS
jgi:anaerobic ribonucleoside-triphosphate reductase activating protein